MTYRVHYRVNGVPESELYILIDASSFQQANKTAQEFAKLRGYVTISGDIKGTFQGGYVPRFIPWALLENQTVEITLVELLQ